MQYTLLNDTKLCYLKLWQLLVQDDVFADTPAVSVKEDWFYQKLDAAIERAVHHNETSPLYEAIMEPARQMVETGAALVEPTLSLHLSFQLDIGEQVISLPYIRYTVTLLT